MTVQSIRKDPESLTMTIVAEFDAPIGRVWQLWEDPRQLERWWGPPTYPATVVDHDFRPGGRVAYYMTGPEGDQAHGWWRVIAVEAPHRLEFEDGFADDAGVPNPDMPTTMTRVTLDEPSDGRTRMHVETRFPSVGAMEQMLEMGMEEGIAAAMGQMDDLLRSGATQR
ncbi:MAG TPA: SRPBCC domain-containing protein [Acidimicrobiia bacterium]|jgi:uncharacterized protein YndB with AHSA1/START domain